ncbi:hypothetical protein BASA61_010585 [Batrachochytrium salamandrivorans]|nr:hypothetical protein BASA62_008734 [Batrachochytrium salamandrivorans]KAH6578911.1 hypothetical protein BASA61_010585 [Batrachochytrium salamandrivorans]
MRGESIHQNFTENGAMRQRRQDKEYSDALSMMGYADSLASTVESWDESEQDYDVKATYQVHDMLESLEGILYKDAPSSEEDSTLLEECQKWSLLFPHLRIRGKQLLQPTEGGYEQIPNDMDQNYSSCLPTPDHTLGTDQECIEVREVDLATNTVMKNESLLGQETKEVCFLYEGDSTVDWTDVAVRQTLSRLHDDRYDGTYWAIYQCKSLAKNADDDDGSQASASQDPKVHTKACYLLSISVICDGVGGILALQERLLKLWGSNKPESMATNVFAIMKSKCELVKEATSIGDKSDISPNRILWTVFSWSTVNSPLLGPQHESDLSKSKHRHLARNPDSFLGPIDYLRLFKDHSDAVFLWSGSPMDMFIETTSTLEKKLTDELHLQESINVNRLKAGVLSSNDCADEWLAYDESEDSSKFSEKSIRSYGVVREDLVSHVFGKLWAEVNPFLLSLLRKSTQAPYSYDQIAQSDQESDVNKGDGFNYIPLNSSTIELSHGGSRPVSARNAQRPTSSRSCTSLSIAFRNQDLHHQAQAPYRHQAGTTKETLLSSWKRNNPGMRLVPLLANNHFQGGSGSASNETIFAESLGISSAKQISGNTRDTMRAISINPQQHLGKKLPPIRSIPDMDINTADPASARKVGQIRHVLFDPTSIEKCDPLQHISAPRSFSARRQTSALLRNRASRPNTAMEESLVTLKANAKSPISAVLGVKMQKGTRRSKLTQ